MGRRKRMKEIELKTEPEQEEFVYEDVTLAKILRSCESWSTIDILKKLCEASDILLLDKSYDGHGYELIVQAKVHGVELIKTIEKLMKKDTIPPAKQPY